MYSADELRKVVEKSKADQAADQLQSDNQKALDYLKKLDDLMMEFAKKGSYDVLIQNSHDLSSSFWAFSKVVRDTVTSALSERGISHDFASKILLSWAKK